MRMVINNEGFEISSATGTLLTHSSKTPMLSVGIGRPAVRSKSGFFSIRENRPKLHKLRSFKLISETDNEIKIRFSTRNSEAVITLTLTKEETGIKLAFSDYSEGLDRMRLSLPARPEEKIYGCGEQYSRLNLRGKKVPLWVSEPGVGRRFDLLTIGFTIITGHLPRWFNTYYPSPVWCSTAGRWFRSTSKAYTVLDFRKKDRHTAYFWEIPQSIYTGIEDNLGKALAALSSSAGRQPKLPDWVYDGFWLGAQGGREAVEQRLLALEKEKVKVGALWCQDWEGKRETSFGKQLKWAWEWDDKLYPDLPEYIASLHSRGIRFLGYNNTFLTPGSRMFDEAVSKNFLVNKADGTPCFVDVPFDPAGMVDFTNPEARNWIKNIIKTNMLEIGMSGWMADFGEMIPHDALLFSGESGLTYHNRYPVEWARINREVVEEAGKAEENIYFMRAGFEGAAGVTSMNWTGDQLVDLSRADGLPSAIMASQSLGMSGVGYLHSDIGGYTTLAYKKRSEDLLMRWTEFAAFTQTMRSHEGNRPGRNAQFGDNPEVLRHLARMTNLFCMLKPYHKKLSMEYIEQGLPPIRPVVLHYPEESGIFEKYPYQYLYGRDILAAPVIKPGRKTWKVRLPEDRWVHLWSGRVVNGGTTAVFDAPHGRPPVFYREASEMKDLFKEIGTACV